MTKLNELRKHLRPGRVYRRADLAQWSNAVDRHAKQLVEQGVLRKLSPGVYTYPKKTSFGLLPPDDKTLVQAFLKDDRFLLTSFNSYNSLGVGTTQLYNETVVYNHKRHGRFKLGGRTFNFRMRPHFPRELTQEFLLVDLVNNLDLVLEDRDAVHSAVTRKAYAMDKKTLSRAARDYGNVRTQKFFAPLFVDDEMKHAA